MLPERTIRFAPPPAYDVVIPCHDRAHVVADAVASVLAQDHPPGFARIDACVALYRTVAGGRLLDDRLRGADNARRVLAHPYLVDLVP